MVEVDHRKFVLDGNYFALESRSARQARVTEGAMEPMEGKRLRGEAGRLRAGGRGGALVLVPAGGVRVADLPGGAALDRAVPAESGGDGVGWRFPGPGR